MLNRRGFFGLLLGSLATWFLPRSPVNTLTKCQHVSITWDGIDVRFYVDGVETPTVDGAAAYRRLARPTSR